MDVAFTVTLDEVSPTLARLSASKQRKAELNELMGTRVQELTRDHLVEYNAGHANKLGGKRTNYWGHAAQDVAIPEALEVNEARAFLNLSTPGLSRAFGDVTIRPGTKTPGVKYLAIPAGPESYGMKPREFDNLMVFFVGRRPAGLATAVPAIRERDAKGGKAGEGFFKPGVVMYWFALSAFQPQNRELLPSDKEWSEAASQGAADFVDHLIREGKSKSKGPVT